MRKRLKRVSAAALGLVTALGCMAGAGTMRAAAAETAETDEIMLGVFWTSDEDVTDTLYWSTNGVDFYELTQAYVDSTPDDAGSMEIAGIPSYRHDQTLHDPSLLYRDGYFWMMAGFTTEELTGEDRRFVPMLGYSDDLIHWSYPASGSSTNVKLSVAPTGSTEKGVEWHTVAPDFMVDDDGTVYIVVCAGYYGEYHGDYSGTALMQPYLVKVSRLELRPEADTINNPAAPPIAEYEDAVPINLPCMLPEHDHIASDHIDASLFKEGEYYYLSIKENGVTDEIYRTTDLSRCQDASAWELVTYDVMTGYEGPCLTKYQGQYFFYTDRLYSYYPVDSNEPYGTNETWVVKAAIDTTGKLDKYTGWPEANIQRINTYDLEGNWRGNRHGTVITLTGEAAAKVRSVAMSKGYTAEQLSNTYNPEDWSDSGWYYKESYRQPKLGGKVVKYWYENGVRQGISFDNPNYRGKEIYDPDSDGWYWLEAQYDGKLAVAEGTYDKEGNEITNWHENGDCQVAQPVDQEKYNTYGPELYGSDDSAWKWVRYDWQGKMVKCNDTNMRFYQDGSNGQWYRYDAVTGAMQKGVWDYVNDAGYQIYCYFDPVTGIQTKNQTIQVNGYFYTFDEYGSLRTEVSGPVEMLPKIVYKSPEIGGSGTGERVDSNGEYAGYADGAVSDNYTGWQQVDGVSYWYENGLRQGYKPSDGNYRGKEIYDPSSNAWYWLDNVQNGAVAKSKDVYQESLAGDWGDTVNAAGERIGKWVRYDENGHMIKGWSEKDGKKYYFDYTFGTMAKGEAVIDGQNYVFDQTTGALLGQ